jgi:ubiquitin carboxyl-terminal hydrolase 22/27/51
MSERLMCQTCQSFQDMDKQMAFDTLPLVLCFHLKVRLSAYNEFGITDLMCELAQRFEHGVRSAKIDRMVQFPSSIDMMPFMTRQSYTPRSREYVLHSSGCILHVRLRSHAGSSVRECAYGLFAVVNHSGSLEAGHYTCYVRSGDEVRFGESVKYRIRSLSVCSGFDAMMPL